MAISTMWTNFLNGDTGLSIRNKLNSFNTNILADMISTEGRVTSGESRITAAEADIIANDGDITALDGRITVNEADILALEGPQDKLQFTPQVTPPAHIEGQVYYNDAKEEFRLQGPFAGVEIPVGHGEHIHVINNTGAILTKGTACRHNGVAAGEVQVVPAIADSFVNARVLGVVAEDIAIGARGALITSGEIDDIDTASLPTGQPLYLSDTVAGTYTTTIPDIVTQVGGAITADALTGRFYVKIINNRNLPTVLSGLKGLTVPSVPLTTVAQDITGYVTAEEVVMLADPITGILTLSNDGYYRTTITADITFPSATSTRTIYVEVYDVTGVSILFNYTKNIPRDATEDAFSFSYPFTGTADNEYKLRVRASTAFTVAVADVTFDIQSININ